MADINTMVRAFGIVLGTEVPQERSRHYRPTCARCSKLMWPARLKKGGVVYEIWDCPCGHSINRTTPWQGAAAEVRTKQAPMITILRPPDEGEISLLKIRGDGKTFYAFCTKAEYRRLLMAKDASDKRRYWMEVQKTAPRSHLKRIARQRHLDLVASSSIPS